MRPDPASIHHVSEFSVQRLFFTGVLLVATFALGTLTVQSWPNPLVLVSGAMTAVAAYLSFAAVNAAFRGR